MTTAVSPSAKSHQKYIDLYTVLHKRRPLYDRDETRRNIASVTLLEPDISPRSAYIARADNAQPLAGVSVHSTRTRGYPKGGAETDE